MTRKQIDLVQIRKMASKKEKENWRFRQFLKGSEGLDIDRCVAAITERVWAGIDCTTCANCCRELQPTFSEEDISRVARRLGMDRQQFINTYLQKTQNGESNPWETRTTPCPFLKGNLCSVYEDRPGDCSDYPHLYKSDFTGIHHNAKRNRGAPESRDSSTASSLGSGRPAPVRDAAVRPGSRRSSRHITGMCGSGS